MPDGHQKLISRVSAIVKTNADNRMTLKFVKYLYRSALECSFSQLGRKMPGILFLNTISKLTPITPALFAFMSALSACDARRAAVKSSGVKVPSRSSYLPPAPFPTRYPYRAMIVAAEEYTRAPRLLWCSRQRREHGSKKRIRPGLVGAALADVCSAGAGLFFCLISSYLKTIKKTPRT